MKSCRPEWVTARAQASLRTGVNMPRRASVWDQTAHASRLSNFLTFQCPFCRVASGDLDDLQQWYGHDLAVVYRNFPIHPFAHSAAVAAECAAGMGAFEALDHRFFCRAGLDRYEVLGELRA